MLLIICGLLVLVAELAWRGSRLEDEILLAAIVRANPGMRNSGLDLPEMYMHHAKDVLGLLTLRAVYKKGEGEAGYLYTATLQFRHHSPWKVKRQVRLSWTDANTQIVLIRFGRPYRGLNLVHSSPANESQAV